MSEQTIKRPGTELPENDPEQGAISTARGARGRVLLLVAAGVVLVTAGALLLVLRSGGDGGPAGGSSSPATSRPTSSPTASGTAVAADPAATGRNPFATPSTTTSSASASASSSSATGTATGSATGSSSTVYLAVFDVASDGTAQFGLNGAEFSAKPGETFGDTVTLTYHTTSKVGSLTCAVVSRGDNSFTACPGEMHTVD